MFNYSDFADKETESYVIVAPAYDFYDHVAQQNKRDDASRIEYHVPKAILSAISYSEACERCGKDLKSRVFIWNRKRLCKSCVEEGQKTWLLFAGSPNAAPQRVWTQLLKKANEHSLINSLISQFLATIGLKRIKKETRSVLSKMPIKQMKLLTVQRPDKKQMPKFEGIMNRKQYLPNR
jgi:hypothetical protein